MKKTLLIAFAALTILAACKKTETVEVEKIVEKTVEVPTNPFKIVANETVALGYSQIADYEGIVSRMKTFANNEGANSYGYYIYYGKNNFDTNVGQVTPGQSATFVLCVTDWNVKTVYSLGWNGKAAANSASVINSNANRPNLVPSNVDFYKNKLCGFITKAEILAL